MLIKSEIVFCQLFKKLLFKKPIILRHYASSFEGKMMNKVMGLRKKTKYVFILILIVTCIYTVYF